MRGKMNSAMAALAMGSAMLHPVRRITAPATMTAAELTASPSTSRYALRTLRLSAAPAWSRRMLSRFTPSPTSATRGWARPAPAADARAARTP